MRTIAVLLIFLGFLHANFEKGFEFYNKKLATEAMKSGVDFFVDLRGLGIKLFSKTCLKARFLRR